MTFTIKDIYQTANEISQLEKIKVSGWVKSIRESKEVIFITINDGSTLDVLQITLFPNSFSQTDLLSKINFASSLIVSGKLILTPNRQQPCELQVATIDSVNSTTDDYPLQKKNLPLEVVRNFSHLRAKTNYF